MTGEETIVEYPVKSIGYRAFSGNQNIVRIYFGEGIEELREQVCLNCRNIESVSFPSTLRYMYNSLQGCPLITTLEFPNSLEYLGESWGYQLTGLIGVIRFPAKTTAIHYTVLSSQNITAFEVAGDNPAYKSVDGCLLTKDGTALIMIPTSSTWRTEYTTPAGVTNINGGAIAANFSLTTLTLSEGVVSARSSIGTVTKLTQLNLPSTLTDNPFQEYANMYNLAAITVAEGNTTYTSVDGVMFTKDLTTLVKFPPAKGGAYTVPSSTKVLGNGSLALAKLQSLTLNDGLLTIQSQALRSVIKLSTSLGVLRIPNTVTSIAQNGLFEAYWEAFVVDTNHPLYTTDGSVLYNKDKTKALVYTCDTSAPKDQAVTLPSTVTELSLGFSYSNIPLVSLNLSQTKITSLPQFTWECNADSSTERELLLPSTLTRIVYNSIRVRGLKTLTIPSSVTTIESGAIGLLDAETITFENQGKFISSNIFLEISPRCVIRGYRGSSAEDIANQYTLLFEPLN